MPALPLGPQQVCHLDSQGTGSRLLCCTAFILMNTCILNKKLPVGGFHKIHREIHMRATGNNSGSFPSDGEWEFWNICSILLKVRESESITIRRESQVGPFVSELTLFLNHTLLDSRWPRTCVQLQFQSFFPCSQSRAPRRRVLLRAACVV